MRTEPWGPLAGPPTAASPRELRRWDLRWSSPWGHEAREERAKMKRRRHANNTAGTLCGAPYGATKRARGAPKTERRRRANCATGTLDGAPCGATKR
eukprot:6746260-Pyramimonas_sp.AAC.1